MAKNIAAGGASNVHPLNPKKPRAGRRTAAAAAAAAKKAEDMLSGKAPPPAASAPPPEPTLQVTAPSFGANEPDCGTFLRELNKIRRQMDIVEQKKLELKTEKGKLKDIRKLAAGVGLVMREVDEALDALNTEHVDLIAREQRRRLYFEWLGLPLDAQPQLPGMVQPTDTEADQAKWRKRGDMAGRLAEERKPPEGCPPHCIQAFLEGWDAGQTALMMGSPLTAAAFGKDGALKATPAAAPPAELLVLQEGDFASGTALDDANLKTLLPGRREAFDAAKTVTAVFGSKRRILKEPGYVDDGEPNTDMTEAEPVTQADREATAAEFA